ncbi:transcriptional regulator, Crp/Fnr family [Winogradskyella psychrotolerans RS-3]|uniref:Transcriptional regulator, Crp/Fnr family n=1 Tax=Winogradskyella psychrotolerans RS-3 TaxID=641526 RepID=S7VSK3_9FLAO|nr:response regulator [Winogradskyella psychrotolerans]EPR72342.1 transcriptional regulator, Crp/Fnr family [Winogradskyella psychrotolerans RS-3]
MTKILLIEDNQDVRENTAEILELANYEVVKAEDGKKGVELAKLSKPDIIICDIMMPELNGYDVLLHLSKDKTTASTPFIFLTAKTEKIDVRKGMNLGADDYLTKPFEESELLDAIASRLHKHSFLKKEFSKDIEGINQFFNDVSIQRGMESLSEDRKCLTFHKKEFVFMEGDTAHTLYFIQKGAIKTYKTTESGKSLVTGLFGPGQFVGQLSLLSNKGTYKDTATVLEQAEVIKIPKADFTTLLFGDKLISTKFITMISNDLIDLQEKLVSMAFSTVRQRLAKVLLDLSKNEILHNSKNQGISISREDLASLMGTATETAIRMLTDFKDEALLSIGTHREIIIEDKKSLKDIALFG